MDITKLLIQLISGAVGGNLAGAALKKFNLGPIGNSIVGILGGGLGGQLLAWFGMGGAWTPASSADGLNMTEIIASIAGGGVGGGVLLAIVGAIRKQMGQS